MDLNVIDREHTAARLPMRAKTTPVHSSIPPAFYGGGDLHAGSLMLASVVTSTSPACDALICFLGTAADPVCRVILPSDCPRRTTAQDVLEIRFLSGLTWEELAELFDTSRRSVHNWANGERMKSENILLLQEMLRHIRRVRRESSAETRLALLTPTAVGRPLDLLKASRWGDAIAVMRSIPQIPIPPSPHPDPTQLHPSAYLDARTDMPGPTSGRAVPGRSRRISRRSP
jgi:hypothetical protein